MAVIRLRDITKVYRVGVEQIAGCVDGAQPQAMLLELSGQPLALSAVADRREVEMRARPRPPGTYAKLDVCDPALRAPSEELAPPELWKGV